MGEFKSRRMIFAQSLGGQYKALVGVIAFGTLMSQDVMIGINGRGKKRDRPPTDRKVGRGVISR